MSESLEERLRRAESLLLRVEYFSEDSWNRALEGVEMFNEETRLARGRPVDPPR